MGKVRGPRALLVVGGRSSNITLLGTDAFPTAHPLIFADLGRWTFRNVQSIGLTHGLPGSQCKEPRKSFAAATGQKVSRFTRVPLNGTLPPWRARRAAALPAIL